MSEIVLAKVGAAMVRRVPYDAEIEYLESTGTQWIETNYIPNRQSSFYTKFYPIVLNSECGPVGCWNGWRDGMWGDDFKNGGLGFCYGTSDYGWSAETYFNNWRHSQYVAGEYGSTGSVWEWSNGVVQSHSHSAQEFTCIFAATLFGQHAKSGVVHKDASRIWYVKIRDENDALVRDFIPVRFTNENGETEGAMYDRVTRALFRNAGTDNFVLGPDKS